jgi:hypothetical protein
MGPINEPFSSTPSEENEKDHGDDEQEQNHAARHQHGCTHHQRKAQRECDPASIRLHMWGEGREFMPRSRTGKRSGQCVVRGGDDQVAIGARS